MVQIHGKGRYKIIANRLIGFSLNLSLEKSVELRSIRISVVDHRLVSIRGGGVSDRGGHLVVSISHGNGRLVDNGVDGLGVGHGGPVDGVIGDSISHGGLFDLLDLNLGFGVDDGSNLVSIYGGVSLRIISISVVENLGISLGLSLSLSLVKAVECRNICRSIVDHRLVMGGISNGVVVVDIGSLVGVSHGGGIGDGRSLDLRGFVDHGVVVVDIGSLVGIDMGNMGLVHSGIGLSLHVDSRVMDHSSVVSDLGGLNAGGVHNGVGRGQSQKRSNNLSNKEKYE